MHPTPQKYNEKFRQALAQLNPEQLAAINKMDSPDLNKGIGKTVKSVKLYPAKRYSDKTI